jgi:uncharacterized protein with PIN domain
MLGYDTLLFGDGPDDELRVLRQETGRTLLSRDSDFLGEPHTLVLTSDNHHEQLKNVVHSYSLDTSSYRYSLCLVCNQPIQRVRAEDYAESVPIWVVKEAKPLWRCPGCEKLYWAGSHLNRMDDRFDRLFG